MQLQSVSCSVQTLSSAETLPVNASNIALRVHLATTIRGSVCRDVLLVHLLIDISGYVFWSAMLRYLSLLIILLNSVW